jgi:uncharacterized membrane protein
MKKFDPKSVFGLGMLLTATILTGCGGGSSSGGGDTGGTDGGGNGGNDGGGSTETTTQAYVDANNELKGDYSNDITLTAGEDYAIDGTVNFLDGATLEIPAGTTLYGETQSSFLAINAGATIMADGEEDAPIIFTSAADFNGSSSRDAQGEWGGLTIIGKAPIVGGTVVYEAGSQVGGGDDPADNSGVLDYVIIKHTGFEVETDKELNGLSLLAVGSGTSISNIGILGGADDGIELWGGTVDVENIYVYNAGDDSIDTDLGYTGTITNGVVAQKVVDATNYDSSGIENGNDSDSYTSEAGTNGTIGETTLGSNTQATMPTFKDITIEAVGGAIYLKNDAGGIFDNVKVTVKPSAVNGQTDTAGQAAVTHRTTDTVDDLSGNPWGVQILGGGLELKNEVTPEAVFAAETAKSVGDGGSADSTHIEAYWDMAAQAGAGDIFVSATTLNDGTTAISGTNFDSAGSSTVTGADQSVFGWVLTELNDVQTQVVNSDITTDTVWAAGTRYALDGEINVTNGANLEIQPGVTVFGLTQASYLAINRGATIDAQGTQAEPIVFTSAADVAGDNNDEIVQGQWGGLTIIGNAPIIGGTDIYEAGTQEGGGNDPADDSGTLSYVVIKNSGFEVEVDKELNGLSLLAVGSGTTLENIAILGGSDDGIELWGGTADVIGLYVFNAGDDSIDTDLGYTGTITNAYVKQFTVDATNYDSSGIENGNDSDSYTSVGGTAGVGTTTSQATMPTFVNVTVEAVGGAIYLKNDAGGIFDNVSIISKDAQDSNQTGTAGQAIVTHRTTDQVDDLSGTPYGIQILSGGLELINEVVATDIYATETAKGVGDGGSTNATHISDYWTTDNPGTVAFETDQGSITGATIADIWKGQAGTNDE